MSPERFIDLIRVEQESLRRFLLALCGGDESLAEKEKASIVLHYFEDRSIKEISSILQVPQGTVKYYLSTGRNHLKSILQ